MRYCSYKQLKFIVCKLKLFYTIIIDFTFALLKLLNKYNAIMLIINKFLKRITTIANKINFFAKE